jgi:uncharacterized membrane protein
MEAATKLQISGLIFTAVVPAVTVAAVALLGRRFRPAAAQSGVLMSFAVVAGMLAAWIGIAGLPGTADAKHWPILAGLLGGVLGLGLDVVFRGRPAAVAVVAVVTLGLGVWRVVAPMAGVWKDGVIGPLASTTWIVDAAAIGLVVWMGVDYAARRAPTPAVLGPLALAFAGAAGLSVLSASALVGQLFGGMGLAIGVAALLGWWKADLRPGHGAIAVAVGTFTALLVYGHITTDSPRAAASLALLTPLAALPALLARRTLVAVLIAGAVALAGAGAAVGLVQAKKAAEDAKRAAEQPAGTPDYSNMGY